jgi:hypothetical protein
LRAQMGWTGLPTDRCTPTAHGWQWQPPRAWPRHRGRVGNDLRHSQGCGA